MWEVEAEGGTDVEVVAVAGCDVALEVAIAEIEVDKEVVAQLVGE